MTELETALKDLEMHAPENLLGAEAVVSCISLTTERNTNIVTYPDPGQEVQR